MKPDLVTSYGERLIIQNIVRNGSLWSSVVFEKEVIFHEFDLETSDLEFDVSKSSIWKHTTLCDNGVFLSFISLNFDDQLSSNVYRFVILCILCRHTQAEKTGLWQLPIVSSVFKRVIAYSTFKKMPKKRSEFSGHFCICNRVRGYAKTVRWTCT